MFDMGAETLALPLEELMKFEQGDNGQSFGFVLIWPISVSHLICVLRQLQESRGSGDRCNWYILCRPCHQRYTDINPGRLVDAVEFFNVSKDDALAYPQVVHITYPSTVNARMENTIAPFVRKALDVTYVVLKIFNDKLGLTEGTLERLHAMEDISGCEARCIRSLPLHGKAGTEKPMLASHTDFGALVCYLLGTCSQRHVDELHH